MRDTWKAAKVGLMIVAGLLVLVAIYFFVEERAGRERGYRVYALFEDAQGLVSKSRVVIAGIPVGYIDSITLENARARVDLYIEPDVALYEDARASKRTVSLLGESIIAIHPGTAGLRQLEDGDRIMVVHETVGTDALMDTVADIAESVKAVTAQLERSFGTDEAGQQMADALRNLSEAIETVNRTIKTNEEVINNTLQNVERLTDVGGDRLVQILENVEVTTQDVREIISGNKEGLGRAVDDVDDTMAAVRLAAERLSAAAGDIKQVTERTAAGEGTIGRLTQDETLIDEVEGVVEGIGSVVGGFARLQTIVELRSEYNVLANSFKSYVSLRLQPREDRYYLIQLVDDPRGFTSFQQDTITRSPPGELEPGFQVVTTETTRRALRFSLMFAKRLGFATFRFGILESTGGLALDLNFMDDRVEINTEVFAIGQERFPRLRMRLAYEIISKLWVLGGVDDVMNERRDFFLGMMLRFNDEDLKGILPFAGRAIAPSG
jgi:phospholipid/cholesterol/gamma-HCH transport system substrate-binding protein